MRLMIISVYFLILSQIPPGGVTDTFNLVMFCISMPLMFIGIVLDLMNHLNRTNKLKGK